MFSESINFDVTLLPGISNMFFGGDGIFVARLTGPGKVWLQSLTLPNLAHAIAPYMGGREAQQPGQPGRYCQRHRGLRARQSLWK